MLIDEKITLKIASLAKIELTDQEVKDLYDMSLMIKNSDRFFCNPSVGQALAIGMYKEYHIAINPKLHLALTHMPIENILNK